MTYFEVAHACFDHIVSFKLSVLIDNCFLRESGLQLPYYFMEKYQVEGYGNVYEGGCAFGPLQTEGKLQFRTRISVLVPQRLKRHDSRHARSTAYGNATLSPSSTVNALNIIFPLGISRHRWRLYVRSILSWQRSQ